MEDKTQQGNKIYNEQQKRRTEVTKYPQYRKYPRGTTPKPLMEIQVPHPDFEVQTPFMDQLMGANPSKPIQYNGMVYYQPPHGGQQGPLSPQPIGVHPEYQQGPLSSQPNGFHPQYQQGPFIAPQFIGVIDPMDQSQVINGNGGLYPNPGSNPGQSVEFSANPSNSGSSGPLSPDNFHPDPRLNINPNEFQPGKKWISANEEFLIREAYWR